MNKEPIKLIALAATGIAIGYGVGFYTTRAKIVKQYEDFIANEFEKLKDDYKEGLKRTNYVSPEDAVADRIGPDAVVIETPLDPSGEVENVAEERPVQNVFDQAEKTEAEQIVIQNQYTVPTETVEPGVFVDGVALDPDAHDVADPSTEPAEHPYVIANLLYHDHDPSIRKEMLTY